MLGCRPLGYKIKLHRAQYHLHPSTSISFLIVCEKCVVCVVNEFHEYNVEGGGGKCNSIMNHVVVTDPSS